MNIKSLILGTASAAALVLASNASAADLIKHKHVSPSAVKSAFSWQGFYAGVEAGHIWGQDEYKDVDAGKKSFKKDGDQSHGNLLGVFAGYNAAFSNNVIAGVDANIDYNSYENTYKTEDGKITHQQKMPVIGDLRARLGYSLDRVLPYVAGGISFANAAIADDEQGRIKDDKIDGVAFKSQATFGWNLGAGVDYAVNNNLVLRADYRYVRFNEPKWSYLGEDKKISTAAEKNSRYAGNNLRVGIAYKF